MSEADKAFPIPDAALAQSLTHSMMIAVCDFEPRAWYGPALPSKRAASHKGHMVRMGLAEHDGTYGGDANRYRLTELGLRVRRYLRANEEHWR